MPTKESIEAAKAHAGKIGEQVQRLAKAFAAGQAKPEDLRARKKMHRRALRRWRALSGKKRKLTKEQRPKKQTKKKE